MPSISKKEFPFLTERPVSPTRKISYETEQETALKTAERIRALLTGETPFFVGGGIINTNFPRAHHVRNEREASALLWLRFSPKFTGLVPAEPLRILVLKKLKSDFYKKMMQRVDIHLVVNSFWDDDKITGSIFYQLLCFFNLDKVYLSFLLEGQTEADQLLVGLSNERKQLFAQITRLLTDNSWQQLDDYLVEYRSVYSEQFALRPWSKLLSKQERMSKRDQAIRKITQVLRRISWIEDVYSTHYYKNSLADGKAVDLIVRLSPLLAEIIGLSQLYLHIDLTTVRMKKTLQKLSAQLDYYEQYRQHSMLVLVAQQISADKLVNQLISQLALLSQLHNPSYNGVSTREVLVDIDGQLNTNFSFSNNQAFPRLVARLVEVWQNKRPPSKTKKIRKASNPNRSNHNRIGSLNGGDGQR